MDQYPPCWIYATKNLDSSEGNSSQKRIKSVRSYTLTLNRNTTRLRNLTAENIFIWFTIICIDHALTLQALKYKTQN